MKDLTSIDSDSDFSKSILAVIEEHRPTKLIETGTYLGTGTTALIASAIKNLEIENAKFYSIEVSPSNCAEASLNIFNRGLSDYVEILNGLSISRDQLLNRGMISKLFIEKDWPDHVYIDHLVKNRVENYYSETNFPKVEDNLLVKCIELFENRPDFVLLDSGGHVGSEEFDIFIHNVKGPCILVLDDIHHVKHYNSMKRIIEDPRFRLIKMAREKFGFCITKFNSGAQ